jgi:predicted metal-dependent phosphoesterase TrpH
MLKIDLHVHTWYSDSTGSVREVLEVAQRKGLDGIAITDHHTLRGAYEALQENNGLVVVPGAEIETTQGELLALGIRYPIPKRLPITEAIRRIHTQKALAIIPHPTVPFLSTSKEKELEKLNIDGLEAFSAVTPLSRHFLIKNMELARRLKLPVTAGSDSHSPETVGDAYTMIYSKSKRLSDILDAIRLGQTFIGGSPSTLKFKLKMLRNVVFHLPKHTFRCL